MNIYKLHEDPVTIRHIDFGPVRTNWQQLEFDSLLLFNSVDFVESG